MEARARQDYGHPSPPDVLLPEEKTNPSEPPHPLEIEVDVDDISVQQDTEDFSDFEPLDELAEKRKIKDAIDALPDYSHDAKEVFDIPPMPHEVIAIDDIPDYTTLAREEGTPPPLPPPAPKSTAQELHMSQALYDWMYHKKDSFAAFSEEQGIPIDAHGHVSGWGNKRKLTRLLEQNPLLATRFQTLQEKANPMNIPKPPSKMKRWMQRIGFAIGLTGAASGVGAYEQQRSNNEYSQLKKQTDTLTKGLQTDAFDTKSSSETNDYHVTPTTDVQHMSFKGGKPYAPKAEYMAGIRKAADEVLQQAQDTDTLLDTAFDGTTPEWKQLRDQQTKNRDGAVTKK